MFKKYRLENLEKGNLIAFGEVFQGMLHPSSIEILTPLKDLGLKLNKKVVLVCLIDDVDSFKDLELLKKCIADEIWMVCHQELAHFRDDLYAEVLVEMVKATDPCGLFFPATSIGCSLAPRIAGRLNLGLCAHVNHLDIEDGKIVMTRPTYGENIIAKLISNTSPVMATLSIGAFSAIYGEKEPKFFEVEMPSDFSWVSKLKVRRFTPAAKQPNRLSTAKVVIAGGRGLRSKENFQKLFELAEVLRAEVGATRPVCYEGWVEEDRMIGISGVTVRPKVYIGLGISGALQHTVGMENSEYIVAVNIDKEAPLVKMAHLGLIGDAPKVLDLLIKRLKK